MHCKSLWIEASAKYITCNINVLVSPLICTFAQLYLILSVNMFISLWTPAGESGDFCWLIHRRCSSWDEVLVLLSVNESVPNEEPIQIQTSSPTHLIPVQSHDSPSVIPDDCGLRFDVTPHLRHLTHLRHLPLCVRLNGIMGSRLQCPPFLVTIRNKTRS